MHGQFFKKKKAHPFYSSARWRSVRDEYLRTVHHVCERCGRPATHVHHRKPLKEGDYFSNFEKCYGFANLEALCLECHNNEPGHFLDGKGAQRIGEGYRVNMVTGEIECTLPY